MWNGKPRERKWTRLESTARNLHPASGGESGMFRKTLQSKDKRKTKLECDVKKKFLRT